MANNDTAALVVALSAQLTKFEKDMKGAVDIADRRTREIETRFGKMNAAIQGKLSELGRAASANIGFAGTLLNTLGPAGIAAAVGIGAAVGGVLALANAAEEFSRKAKLLKEGAETAGLTITQFKLLGQAGKTVGLDFDETAKFFTEFISRLEALRQGGGPLFDALLKIDTELLRQLSVTKDAAAAIDILVAAYKRLDDQAKRLELSKAAGGKAGATGGRLLDTLGNQGGVSGLVANSPAIDEGQINRAAQLRVEIDAIAAKTQGIWGGMFSDSILTNQKNARLEIQAISEWIAKIVTGKKELQSLDGNAPGGGPLRITVHPAAPAPGGATGGATGGSPSIELAILQKNLALLGDAVTVGEQWKLKRLEIAAATEKGGIADGTATRALNAFRVTMIAAATAARERLGIATQEQITEARLAQLSQDRVRFGLTENEVGRARNVILREAKDAADALTVRQAYLPGLKQMELDALNARKQIDTLGVNSLNNLENALVDVISGTKSAAEAFRAMANAILQDLARIAIRQAITGPLAGALGGLFGVPGLGTVVGGASEVAGGRASGGQVSAGQTYVVGEAGPELVRFGRDGAVIPNHAIGRSSQGGDINVTLSMDLTGVNGDETIRRISAAAAQKAFTAAVATANAGVPARQARYRQLGT